MSGKVIVATHKFELLPQVAAWTGIFETLVSSSEGFISTDHFAIGTPYELYDSYPSIYLDMSDTWEILVGHRSAVTCCSHDPANVELKHDISWPTILPYFPPDSTQAQ
jgi:hypothetical protein